MTDKHDSSGNGAGDGPEFERRQVLAGIGGMAATGAIPGFTGGSRTPAELVERWADRFAGVTTARDREELEHLIEELRADGRVLATRDLEEFGPARRQAFAAKGRRLRSMMAGECGYEGYEVWGGPYDGCCAAHDECEGQNDEPDSVFNGDDCDDMFWSCVALVTVTIT